jgi:hypothetical protein
MEDEKGGMYRGKTVMYTGFWGGNLKESDHSEELNVDSR